MENVRVHAMIQKHRINKKGEVPIALCITLENKPVTFISLKKRISISDWDTELREVRKRTPNSNLLNALIRSKIAELDKEITERQLLSMRITKAVIKIIAKGGGTGGSFPQFCRKRIPEKYPNPNTRRTYENETNKLEDFKGDVTFGEMTVGFLEDYRRYLSEKGNEFNTIWKAFKFINTMFIDAVRQGIIREKDNPFNFFDRGKYQEPKNEGITLEECKRIETYCMEPGVPENGKIVALYFLLMCYSGLRISDAYHFDPKVHLIDGRIRITTEKFDVPLEMKINKRLSWVLDKLPPGPLSMPQPIFRMWLKVVTGNCGITRPVNPHMGRHTFGTLLATAGIPTKHAQKLMAHKNEKSTLTYYHIVNKALDIAVEKLENIL